MPISKYIVQPEHLISSSKLPQLSCNAAPTCDDMNYVCHTALINLLRQMADLSDKTADIMAEILNEVTALDERANKLQDRTLILADSIDLMEIQVMQEKLDKKLLTVVLDPSNVFKGEVCTDQAVVNRETMPDSLLEIYKEKCECPPNYIDSYDEDNNTSCLKKYSDPNYFFDMWSKQMLSDIKPKKQHKGKRPKRQAEYKPLKVMASRDYKALAMGKELADSSTVFNNKKKERNVNSTSSTDILSENRSKSNSILSNMEEKIKSTTDVDKYLKNEESFQNNDDGHLSNISLPPFPDSARLSTISNSFPEPPAALDVIDTVMEYNNFLINEENLPPAPDFPAIITESQAIVNAPLATPAMQEKSSITGNNSCDLLSSIRAGIQLRKVSSISIAKQPLGKKATCGVRDVQAIFEEAMLMRRKQLVESDEEDSSVENDESDTWDSD